jgi:hypothetical protein
VFREKGGAGAHNQGAAVYITVGVIQTEKK